MFERYTEKARRVIFFARYEASRYGIPFITTEHLLLGLLREDKSIFELLIRDLMGVSRLEDDIRAQQQRNKPEKVSTSVDLPLDNPAKRALAYAAEEAERLSQRDIGTEHLLLGLLREPWPAAEILQRHGIDLSTAREAIREAIQYRVASDPHRMVVTDRGRELPAIEFVDADDLVIAVVISPGVIPALSEEIVFGSKSFRVVNVSYHYPDAAEMEAFSKKLPKIRVRLEPVSEIMR